MAQQTAAASAAATADATRGRPYYDKLRKELKQTIAKKRELDSRMQGIEAAILQYESSYLEETTSAGNIIRGFDNYIKASGAGSTSTSTGGGTATRRKGGISEADRIFSRSSVGWNNEPPTINTSGHNSNGASGAGTPAGNTPTGAAAGGGGGNKGGGNKTKKKGADKETDDERPAKRGKVTWGRD